MAQTWLGVLGAAYATITVACRLDAIYAVIGQQVSLTIAQLPDVDAGGRGITSASGVVIGRKVKPLDAVVELTVLTTQVRIAGYAPSSLIDTVTLVSGISYDIVLDATQPAGYADISNWAIGDAVRIATYDNATPASAPLVVTAVDFGTLTVTATLTSGAIPTGTRTLEYDAASVVQTSQERYAFIAVGAPDNNIPFASGNAPPRQFAS